jgi:hypothetical protein
MDASAGQPAYIPPQKLREALQRLVKALISAIAAVRDRRLASATYDVRAELAEMQDIDDWCPQDDITGVRIVTDIALMLALTQALPTSVALACLRRILLEIDQSADSEHGVASRSPCHHHNPPRLDLLP